MAANKISNVLIPLLLFEHTFDFLNSIDINTLDYPVACLFEIVLSAFQLKKHKMELRDSYAKIIFAQNEVEQTDARMNYLFNKRRFLDE